MAGTAVTEPCGCKSDDSHWLVMCAAHRAEIDETNKRWAEARQRLNATNIEDLLR